MVSWYEESRKDKLKEAKIVIEYAKNLEFSESIIKYLLGSVIEKAQQPGVEMPDLMQFLWDCKEELE